MNNKERIEYINSFWHPKVGSTIKECDGGRKSTIIYVDDEFPEQVKISGSDDIYYTQDLLWVPSLDEVIEVIKDIGVNVYKDQLEYCGSIRKYPRNANKAIDILLEYRVLGMQRCESINNAILN